ncbi:MAG: hypothetical protein ACFFD2_18050 [Promethearchaeota archaeon]
MIVYTIGKRTLQKPCELLHQVPDRTPEAIPYFTSDALEHYVTTI